MKFSILGFNQEKVLEIGLNIKQLHLLNYIYDAIASPSMCHIVEDDVAYVWLQHEKLLEDLPILEIGERALVKHLSELKSLGLIQTKNVANSRLSGSRCYYAITPKCEELRYSIDKNKNACLYRQEQKCVSNKQLIDNKLNIDNTNVLSTENSVDDFLVSEISNKPKVKKPTLYSSCLSLIEEFTEDQEVRDALKEFLNMRIANKNKPFGSPTFKGTLKKLRTLTDSKEMCIKIIQQATDRCYLTFYPLSNGRQRGCPEIISKGEKHQLTDYEYEEAMELDEKF